MTEPADAPKLGLPVRLLRVMIGSPGDVQDEVEVATRLVHEWNTRHAEDDSVVLVPKHWSWSTHPRLSGRPQAEINRQLADRADILLAVFRNRLGSDTGAAPSGTVEEIERFLKTGRIVKLYFYDGPVPREVLSDATANAQYQALEAYKAQARTLGLYHAFGSVQTFERDLREHLRLEVLDLRRSGFRPTSEPAAVARTPGPDRLATLRGTVLRLQMEWRAEAAAQLAEIRQAQRITSRFATALSEHFGELHPTLTAAQLTDYQALVTGARNLTSSPITFGMDDWFWSAGEALFQNALEVLTPAVEA